MPGWYGLAGGTEFGPMYQEGDRDMLRLASPTDLTAAQPGGKTRVLIFPTAQANSRPEHAARDGVRHFTQLGASARSLMALRRDELDDPALLREVEQTDLVYFCGGDPGYLLRQAQGTRLISGLRDVVARGGIVAGSSAGAMVMGAFQRVGAGIWEAALGLVPAVAVLPHHRKASPLPQIWEGLRDDILLLGIPEGTTVLCESEAKAPGSPRWRVLGSGPLTLYTADAVTQVPGGAAFDLSP